MATVQLTDLTKRFAKVTALEPTSLTIDDGEFVVIVGPSGCGKSTILRMIAGLDVPSGGRIRIGDRDVTDAAPSDRELAMVFQSYALYPHLTVAQNIGFPLKVGGMAKAQVRERVMAVAETLELTALLSRRPAELSGGQRQRVSIARAIVREPKVLLLDEPLSNLDAELRVRMRHEFARLHARLGTTMIYVTHDQLEAMTLANRIVVMRSGRVEQVGAPLDLYARPATLAVARAIGSPGMNLMEGVVVTADGEGAQVRRADGGMLRADVTGAVPDMPVTIGVRPEHLVADEAGPFGGRVELFERLGPLSFVHLGTGDGAATVAQLPGDLHVTLGEMLRFRVAPGDVHLFDGDGRALPRLSP